MAARKPNHPLQRYEKRAAARLCYLPPPTPRAGTRSIAVTNAAVSVFFFRIIQIFWRNMKVTINTSGRAPYDYDVI